MASYGQAVPPQGHQGHRPGHAPPYGAAQMPVGPPGAPVGTFSSGTKIQVGSHRVVIQKYLSEGGFAHVYLVKLPAPVDGTDQAVLKRVAVPDKEALRGMRIEVETMKRLKGHKPIVTYIDSHASELRGGGYEVFLLMEYCNGGGLIDFMNTRLQHRLTEPEILSIFADVAEGVACMHYLKPPLLHRDLKVENVLITVTNSVKKFKLCDFGSAAPPRSAPTTVVECRLVDEDVQKHTTMQYRSPEMIDVYRKQPIDEKSDIWALGVLLYKLCYYTTPFEEQGQLAILNASYKFPSYPPFSDKLKRLIGSMLREDQKSRPNIYEVVREACAMRGLDVPIKDIYSERSHSEPRKNDVPRSEQKASAPVVGAVFSPPAPQQRVIPEVERMRRGRPPVASQQPVRSNRSPPKVTNGDPFAALDSKFNATGDELSSKFPTLDQFSLLHDSGSKFDFDDRAPPAATQQQQPKDVSKRMSQRLADEAFSQPPSKSSSSGPRSHSQPSEPPKSRPYPSGTPDVSLSAATPKKPVSSSTTKSAEMSRAAAIISNSPELQAISSQASLPPETTYQPAPRSNMVSTGTMTTTPPPERPASTQYQVYRFPPSDQHRSTSMPRQPDTGSADLLRTDASTTSRPGPTSSRPIVFQSGHARQPSSSRPSLEGGRPDSDLLEPMGKSRSTTSPRQRPASTHLESNIDYLREREASPKPLVLSPSYPPAQYSDKQPPSPEAEAETNITSNVAFLRSMEDSDPKRKEKHYHKHGKRSSLTSISTGTKNILSGKFGDAFKRFEGNSGGQQAPPPRTPSPLKDLERRDLTPIAGSEATDGRSDDGQVLEETDGMTPEMRRELERRRLSEEERRVAAAAAEYRQRVQGGGSGTGPTPLPKSIGGVSRAVSIQNKVQSLLDESNRSSGNVSRTAQGYGHFSDTNPPEDRAPPANSRPPVPRKPTGGSSIPLEAGGVRRGITGTGEGPSSTARPIPAGGAPKPTAPPKPTYLSNQSATGGRAGSPPKPSMPTGGNRSSIDAPRVRGAGTAEQLVAVDLPGQPAVDMTAAERDDYIRDFQKRFPSLTSIEMVERDLDAEADAAKLGR